MKFDLDNIENINWVEFKAEAQEELDAFEVKNVDNVPLKGKFLNICCWTDVLPCLILEVKGKTMIVEELDHVGDHTVPGSGRGHQDWIIYRHDHNPIIRVFTLRKNGRWVEKGSPMNQGYHGNVHDKPWYHYDWEF